MTRRFSQFSKNSYQSRTSIGGTSTPNHPPPLSTSLSYGYGAFGHVVDQCWSIPSAYMFDLTSFTLQDIECPSHVAARNSHYQHQHLYPLPEGSGTMEDFLSLSKEEIHQLAQEYRREYLPHIRQLS